MKLLLEIKRFNLVLFVSCGSCGIPITVCLIRQLITTFFHRINAKVREYHKKGKSSLAQNRTNLNIMSGCSGFCLVKS